MIKKNKKGIALLFYLMVGVLFFILGMALAPALKDTTDQARNDTQLNCSTTTDNQTKAVCRSIDIQQVFIGIIFGLAGLVIVRGAA